MSRTYRTRAVNASPVLLATLFLSLSACGVSDDEERSAPPPVVGGTSDTLFALEGGTYYASDLRDLQDGCGKKPMESDRPLTSVPFFLANDGASNISIDFCSYDGRMLQGAVRGNEGTLAVNHANRRVGSGTNVPEFTQDCRLDLTVTADNRFEGHYVETQRNRNEIMRLATVDVPECTTSFKFVMERKD